MRCSFVFGKDAESTLTYKGSVIYPGKEQKSKLTDYSVSGFSTASTVAIIVTSVTFDNGLTYSIPVTAREIATLDMR